MLLILLFNLTASAHAVQVGYYVLPNGFIRVYIEHWHGDQTTATLVNNGMSITTTYGSTTVTQNVNPTGAVNNTAWNALPFSGPNLHILSAGPSANQYNDWAYYDFAPAACNVPVQIVLNGGLTVVLEEESANIWPQTISGTFNDNAGPTIMPQNTTATVGCGSTGTNVNFSATSVDNCTANPSVSFNIAPGSFFPVGTTNVTATSSDANGNTSTLTFPVTVTVIDNVAPVPNVASLPTLTGECGVTATAPTATDNCSGTITATTSSPLVYNQQGTYTIQWVYKDATGNTSTQSQTVIVKDVTPPVIACPFNITVNAAANSCGAVVTYNTPSATDNCGNGTLPTSLPGYTYKGTFGGHTYFISNTATTPEDAHAKAIALGGHLVTISSLAENQFVSAMSPAYIWIGYTDRAVEGSFKWVTSEPVSYTNWNSGEPNNAGDEDWAVINWGPNGTWNDWTYNSSALFVVEFEGGNIPTTLVSGPASGSTFPIGNTVVTYEAVDAGGNRATCSFTVTVLDNQNPTITAPAAVTVNTNANACVATNVALGSPVANDNCTGFIVSNNAPATFAKGTTVVTWTVKDASGRTATATQLVTVADNQAPAITAPAAVTVSTNPGQCSATNVALGNAVASDNCGSVTISNNAPAVFPKGTTLVTWTAKDGAGLTTTATQNVTVVDNESPVITAPAAVAVNTDAGACSASNVALGNAVATDNCGSVIVSNDAPAIFPKGTTIVTWTAKDAAGKIATATQTVVVTDKEAPSLSAVAPMNVNTDAGQCGAVVMFPAPVASDNCGAVTVAQIGGPASGSVFPVGTTTVTFEATDAAGNKSTGSFTVTVTDNEAPVPTVGTGTSQSNGSVTIGLPSGYSYNWVMYQHNFQDPLPAGATVTDASMSWSGHDQGWGGTGAWARMIVSGTHIGSGQYFGWNQGFSINYSGAIAGYNYGGTNYVRQDFDTYPGWVGYFNGGSLTLNYTAQSAGTLPDVNAECSVTVPAPTATDNCGAIITGTTSDATTYSQQGTYIIHWTYTDAAGNRTSQDQKVVIKDVTAPVLVGVPANETVECDAVPAAAVVTATDNCEAGPVSYNEVRTNGNCISNYTLTRTWSVTDIGGNTTVATQVVTVQDTKAPALNVQDVTVTNDAGQCGAAVAFAATASDNCGDVTVAYSQNPGTYFPVGTTTVTATATDACGNQTVKTFIVTVNDTEVPVVRTQNLTIQLDASGAASITAAQVDNASTDNCGVAAISVDKTSFNCSNVGANTVTLSVTDIHGNVNSATAVVTVEDNVAPVITNVTGDLDRTVECSDAKAIAATLALAPAATDNCAPVSIHLVSDVTTANCGTTYTRVRQWNFTDPSGNTSALFTQTVNVVDRTAPVVTVNAGAIERCFDTTAAATYAVAPLQATDNCNAVNYSFSVKNASGNLLRSGTGNNASGTFPLGANTILWTVTDACGNVTTATTLVTINPLPAASLTASGADAFCNGVTLSGASTLSGPFGYQWYFSGAQVGSSQALTLGNASASGVYTLFVTDGKGCRSPQAASYTYIKETAPGNYTVIGIDKVSLGEYNSVRSGSVGVMSPGGYAYFRNRDSVVAPGAFVMAPNIYAQYGYYIPQKVYGPAPVILPAMQSFTGSYYGLPSTTIGATATGTVAGDYNSLYIRRGANVTLNGTTFRTLTLEEGARVRFSSTVLNMESLFIGNNTSATAVAEVRFAPGTALRVSRQVKVEEMAQVNPEGVALNIYVNDAPCTEEKFIVKGNGTRVTANLLMPGGKLSVQYNCRSNSSGWHDCHDDDDDDRRRTGGTATAHYSPGDILSTLLGQFKSTCAPTYMTGRFIAGEVESGVSVIWSSNQCSAETPTVDSVSPQFDCPAPQEFCQSASGIYTLTPAVATDNSGVVTISYKLTGATVRSGAGANASGSFNPGITTITWTATDASGNKRTCSQVVRVNATPVVTIRTDNSFCTSITLTAQSGAQGPLAFAWTLNNNVYSSAATLNLSSASTDGTYRVSVTDVNGCTSVAAAAYAFSAQNLVGNYTIVGLKEVNLGENNTVVKGGVGVVASNGEARIKKNSSVAGFVKAKYITTISSPVTIGSRIYAPASVSLPAMQVYSGSFSGLANYTVPDNATVTLTGNYATLTVRKGAQATLNGTVFRSIKLEEGARVTFTQPVVNLESLVMSKGKSNKITTISFAGATSVRVSQQVLIEEYSRVNGEGRDVTFYVGDQQCDDEKFRVDGNGTTVTANVLLPNGTIRVDGGSIACQMTGVFIAEEVRSENKNITWNGGFSCAPAPIARTTSVPATTEARTINGQQPEVEATVDASVVAYPNPSRGIVNLRIAGITGQVQLAVVDSRGNTVARRAANVSSKQENLQLDLQSAAAGIYTIRISDGTQVLQARVVIAR
ncbi:HYR domain-containing protein [Flaviaesturariibacter flavus]|uniref:HYR domain-containing protein n=1 Tax=Flaviaesturariibacter flavus TaxID=2502780 RepID=UPI0014051790|nr:HYR domain-containing protein [Flaviaesturariibacter flavus]